MKFVEHNFIKQNTIESRLYQEKILGTTIKGNTLVVLPTGLGKTITSALLVAHILNTCPGKKILILAPTKPLISQHNENFKKMIKIDTIKQVLVTGIMEPKQRKELYKDAIVIFATPQCVSNDILSKRFDLSEISLIVFDEAQHAVGKYSYTLISKEYIQHNKTPLILGLTASPGDNKKKIKHICDNLFIDSIEIKTETDDDVKPYIKEKKTQIEKVDLPKEFLEMKNILESLKYKKVKILEKSHLCNSNIGKRQMLELQKKFISNAKTNKSYFYYISLITELIKIDHILELLETQGIAATKAYFDKLELDDNKASKRLLKDNDIIKIKKTIDFMYNTGVEHPKINRLKEILSDFFDSNRDSKVIVFAHFRSTAEKILHELEKIDNFRPIKLIGQSGIDGIIQKKQIELLNRFKEDEYNILITTSIGEEGLDIAEVNLVVFYEPIASIIRRIQRSGRTGRLSSGDIVVLITRNTRDEAYHWKSYHGEKRMKNILESMKVNEI